MQIDQYKDSNLYIVTVTREMGPEIFPQLQEYFGKKPESEKIKLLGLFEEFEDFEAVKKFVQGIIIDRSSVKRLVKYGVVSNKRWFAQVLEFEEKLVPNIPFKFFKSGQQQKAISWLLDE
jgi:hypothetical protein